MVATVVLAIVLAGEMPVAVDDVVAEAVDGRVRVRWTTNVPTRGRVEYGPDLAAGLDEHAADLRGSTNAGRDAAGTGFANNHRVDLPWPERWPARYRVVGETSEGTRFATGAQSVAEPPAVAGSVARATVPIAISGQPLPGQPVVLGLPFPAGHLASGEQVRMLAGGQELATQAVVVSRWPDRSVKWLRVGFVPPSGATAAALEYGREVQPARPSAGQAGIVVDPGEVPTLSTGGARLRLPLPRLAAADGQVHLGVLRRETVEEPGPVRKVLRWDGDFGTGDAPGLRFAMRLHLFADQPYARLDFTFENGDTTRELTRFRALSLDLAEFPAGAVTIGQGEATTPLASGERVLQREDFEWVAGPADGPAVRQGKRLDGLVTAPGLALGVRDFWQQYPIGFSRRDGSLAVELYPPLPEGFYAARPDEDKLYYQLRTGLHEFRQGWSKTHELWLDLSGRNLAGKLLADPPLAAAPPAWIEASGAMRDLAVAVADQFPEFDQRQMASIDQYLAVRDRAREYGVMNFGDWYGERTWNWGNLEYDLGHAFLMLYARSGYAPFFHRATEAVRHQRDVDTRHAADDPKRVGQQWTHAMGHTAGYYPPDYKDMKVYATPGWSDNRGHIWCQGMFEQYLLGGDRRSWDTARLVADWAAGPQTTNFRFYNAREPGWMLILVMGAYNATGDPFYLNAAKLMLREVQRMSEATGNRGFHYHSLPAGHCDCEVKHDGEAGFMLGVLMTGMKMAYEALGDERIADDITKTAKFLVETMYEPRQKGFRYTSCPKTSVSGGSVFIELEGLAFAAARTGDPELTRVVREAVAASWDQIAGAGKSAGYQLCSLPQGLTEFSKLPGESLAAQYATMQRWLRNPARRPLPALVPNGDFEEDVAGWTPRPGIQPERVTAGAHSGQACLKLTIACSGQNEYLNTRYDTSADPTEIRWLKPGETYRFTAWVKVEKLSAGAPAPSLRLQFRDAGGSKNSAGTNAYDLTQLGTWQKLTADVPIPEWNTRNYLALNTNTREPIQGVLYLDDVSLVPVAVADRDAYRYIRLDPAAAQGGLSTVTVQDETWLARPGTSIWQTDLPAGRYRVWVKADGPAGPLAELRVGATNVVAIQGTGEAQWTGGELVELPAGKTTVTVRLLGDGARVGRVVLTDDPSTL